MADINFSFGSEDLEQLKKLLADIRKEVEKIRKSDIIDQDEALKAKKLTAEMLKVENALKRQEMAAKNIEERQDRRNQKLKTESGIIGGLEKQVRDLTRQWKSATTEAEKLAKKAQLDKVKKQLTDAKNTTASWSKALGSFQFKFNALGNIAANVTQRISTGIREVIRDSMRMALEFEGVNNAFQKMNDPNLLGNLQKATRGTVNNLELMKSAVNARNFKIPMEQFSTFLAFATNRAIETGESVDYLVESIVKGLGRKSVLILDNLGLSVAEINEEVKKTGDFMQGAANIIQREMEKSGEVVDTELVRLRELNAEWDNLKIKVGTFFKSAIVEAIGGAGTSIDILGSDVLTLGEKLTAVFGGPVSLEIISAINDIKTGVEDSIKPLGEMEERLALVAKQRAAEEEAAAKKEKETVTLEKLNDELKFYQDLKQKLNITDTAEIARINGLIDLLKKQIEEIDNLGRKKEEEKDKEEDLNKLYERRMQIREQQQKLADDLVKKNIDNIDEEIEAMLVADQAFIESEEEKTEKAREEAEKRKQIAEDEKEAKRQAWDDLLKIAGTYTSRITALQSAQKEKELSAVGDNAAKRLEIEKEYAKKEQNLAIAEALINGATGITGVWRKWGWNPAVAAIFTALVAGATALEVATIKAQKFAKGGEVGGRLHSQGGTMIEAERGEYVINRRSASKYKDLIEGINENDQLKIMMALDKDRKMPQPKSDPWTRKIYEELKNREVYGETPGYYVIRKGNMTTKIRK